MKAPLRLLLVEDEEADFLLIERQIRRSGLAAEIRWVKDGDQLGLALDQGGWDLVLSDYNVTGLDFLATLKSIKAHSADVPIILVSGSIGEETAVELLKSGLSDFVLKDRLFRLIPAIERSLSERAEIADRKKAEESQRFSFRLLQLVHDHTDIAVLIADYVGEIKAYLHCDAVGVRVLDEDGNIPYQAYEGFSPSFFESESPLSIKSDQCMCINVITGDTDPQLPFYTAGGSFYMNATTRFLATVAAEDKGETRNICKQVGYESVALVPFRSEGRILGLIHVADRRENMVPLAVVELLERAVMQLGTAFARTRAQLALQASEERFRAIIDNAASVVWVKDLEGRIQVANAYLLNLLGKSRNEVIGSTTFDLLPPALATAIAEGESQVLATGLPIEIEESIPMPKGPCTFLSVKFPLRDGQGRIYAIGALCTEITKIKQTEALLKQQEENYRRLSLEYRALLDNVPDAIVHLSPQLEIRWANAAADKMFALPQVPLVYGQTCHQAFWNKGERCLACPVIAGVVTGSNTVETFTSTKDGRELEVRAVPLIAESGEVEGVIEIIRDVTAHRKLEEQFRQAQKMESIGTLAGGIAHDFNNILSAILGYGELALEDLVPGAPARKSVEIIIEAGQRASHLTKDLLLFSRKQVSQKQPVEVNTIIARVEKFLRRVIGEDVQCQSHLSEQPLAIFADGHQIEQVLMNFATNARDAMPGGGIFTITTGCQEINQDFIDSHGFGRPGSYALITVADTGRGMEKQTAAKIFEPFFTTKEMGKGTGLGLAVVYGIIKDHQGYINVYSEADKGTVFRVYLPLISDQARATQAQAEQQKPPAGKETILLAEDEASVRRLYATVLRQYGYSVIEAANGEEAVRQFQAHQQQIDLLLFDLIMPRMNGKLALDAIRNLQANVRGIFISGYAPENIQQRDLHDLQMEVLFKPVSPRELLRTIRRVLDAP